MPYLAVGIGGFIGAILRYGIGEWIGTVQGFPISTLLINVLGCFVLAWFYTITLQKYFIHPHIRLGAGTGLVGAFTTFSTFSVETWALIQGGLYGFAALYVAASFLLGLTSAYLGYGLARRQSRLRFVGNPEQEG